MVKKIFITFKMFTIDNGTLTPTLKIKRARIEEGVADRVDGWYRVDAQVVWD